MKTLVLLLAVAAAALDATAPALADPRPLARAAVVCADYPTQAAAQAAADTRDSDKDGIYCEELACPCSPAWHAQHGGDGGAGPAAPSRPTPARTCSRTRDVVEIGISKTRYLAVLEHVRTAITAGFPGS